MNFRDRTMEDIREEGRKEGRKEGREEGRKEIVKFLLTEWKMTDQQAADIINLSVDNVSKIRREIGQ